MIFFGVRRRGFVLSKGFVSGIVKGRWIASRPFNARFDSSLTLSRSTIIDHSTRMTMTRRFYSSEITFAVDNDDDFNEKVLNSSVPVIVDFHADWCGPCQMLGPRLEAKVEARGGTVLLAKVNVDYAADLAGDFDVRAVPTVIAFKNGNAVDKFQGVRDDDEIDAFIDDLVHDS